MKNRKLLFGAMLLLLSSIPFTQFAQQTIPCFTNEATQKFRAEHPDLQKAWDDYQIELSKPKFKSPSAAVPVHIIPMVFHVLYTSSTQNISDATIQAQVAKLNTDYRKLNADTSAIVQGFDTLCKDVHIEFRLAQLDPNGNCTNGIDRIYTHKTFQADESSKLNQWPRDKYLNIWVVDDIAGSTPSATILGYAHFPSDVSTYLFPYDGIIAVYNTVNGTSRTLTHEIGHYLSLEHPWGSTNSPEVACGDDGVDDTPMTKGHFSTCVLYTPDCNSSTVAASYPFTAVTTASGTSDTAAVSTTTYANYSSISAVGVSSNSSTLGSFGFTKWDTGSVDGDTALIDMTGSINTGKYYQFTVSPKYQSVMTLTGITFNVSRNSTGMRSYAVRSSLDGYTSNLNASISPANTDLSVASNEFFYENDASTPENGSKITLSGASFTSMLNPVTFRIYAWNAEDTLGSFEVDNIAVNGTDGALENTQNYMDYSSCTAMFTVGQITRMRNALESTVSSRNNLWSTANLAATGVSSPAICAPRPEFYASRNRLCAGGTVNYTKNFMNGTETSRTWTFYGGSPSIYTASGNPPAITYSTPGLYKVSVTAANSAGTDSVVKTNYIRVDANGADVSGVSFSEGFESISYADFFWKWTVNNFDNNYPNTWDLTSSAGYNSSHSAVMNGYGNYPYDVDELYTPMFNMTGLTGVTMTFRLAGASHAGASIDMNDDLKIYVSTNCGSSWLLRSTLTGSSLINNGYVENYFIPTSPSQWNLKTVTIPVTSVTSNTQLKFVYTSGDASNNIYIDDVNINGTVGITENSIDNAGLIIYPNPSNGSCSVAYRLNKKATTKLEVVDVLGKKVAELTNGSQPEGEYTFSISKEAQGLRNGIYFVRLSIDNESTTQKLIITQ